MKLKFYLLIALVIVIVPLFMTSIVSKTDAAFPVAGIVVDSESKTTVWDLMWENLFTSIPDDDAVEDLAPFAALGIDEDAAIALVDEHGTGNSVLSGLLGLLPILGIIAGVVGVALLVHKEKLIKWLLYSAFGLVFASTWAIWFATPSKLKGIEGMYNAATAAVGGGLGTLMADGTVFTMGMGLFISSVGALFGIVALVLNHLGKIEA